MPGQAYRREIVELSGRVAELSQQLAAAQDAAAARAAGEGVAHARIMELQVMLSLQSNATYQRRACGDTAFC